MAYIRTLSGGEINRNVLELYMQAGSSNPTAPAELIETSGAHVIPGGRDEATFDHGFETASIVPAFTPSWNTMVYPTWITTAQLRVGFGVAAPAKNAAVDFVVSEGTRLSVTAGSETKVITHNLNDATAVVLVSAGWNTQIWRTAKAANSMTVAFSTPPPADNYLYYSRHAEDDDITGTDTVTVDSATWTITHNGNYPFLPIFLLPSWNTAIWYANKAELNTITVRFSTPPLSGSGSLDWRVKFLT